MSDVTCPICQNHDGYECKASRNSGGFDAAFYDCEVCGKFGITRTALEDDLIDDESQFSLPYRAAISHYIKLRNINYPKDNIILNSDDLERFDAEQISLPNPSQQATNIIRFIGDIVASSGKEIDSLSPDFSAIVGSPSREFACDLLYQLNKRDLVRGYFIPDVNGPVHAQDISLTLSGWDMYESERQGRVSGTYGFLALKFGDEFLDPLVRDHIKPAIKSIGYEAVDLRDVSRAGVIDNLLRIQIRDAAFVIVDLTHDNAGAYWEAGYAEGLGKPVLYICQKEKFDSHKTHFDTNHCTTVMWDLNDIAQFTDTLVATLQRSLNR